MMYELQKTFRYSLLNYQNRVMIDFSYNTRALLKVLSHVSLLDIKKSFVRLSKFNKENHTGYYMGIGYFRTGKPHLLLYKYYDKKFYLAIHICEDGSMLYAQSDPTFISNISLTICPKIL